jgi:regulator of sigma E protease
VNSFLAFLFVLGVLVFVHELGHFVMARRHGVRVLTFSLGFGPKVARIVRGGTEYCISAIPLGGYVKMAGETPDDPRSGASDEFLSKTKWQRFQILIMGPVMNIVLALVVMTAVLYNGAPVPAYEQQPPVIGTVLADSPAEKAGLRTGDRVVSVAGQPDDTWQGFFLQVMPRAERQVALEIERDGQRRTLQVVPAAQTRFEMGDIGVLPEMHPQIRSVNSGSPAEQAGLRTGDVVLGVKGHEITRDRSLVKIINENPSVPLTLSVRRQGQVHEVVVTPLADGAVGRIGVSLSPYEERVIEPTLLEAARMSWRQNLEWSTLIFQAIVGLVNGQTSPKQLMGPVAIGQLAGDAAGLGFVALFSLMAMISLNLGIINLLPIPVLDGGHIFIMAIEGIARRDFSMHAKEKMLLAGFVVLMALMVTVIYNDLMRIEWIERLVPWR